MKPSKISINPGFRWFIYPLLVLLCTAKALAWEGSTDDVAWENLLNTVRQKQSELVATMARARKAGITTDYAFVSKVVIDHCLVFAQYDRDHPDEIEKAYSDLWWTRKIPDRAYAASLPFDELMGCMEVADHAISELQDQLARRIVLDDPPDFRAVVASIGQGSFLLNGEPVFPSSFSWMPNQEDLMVAFGRMGGVYYALTDLQENGLIKKSALQSDILHVEKMASANIGFQQYFIGHAAPSWMTRKYPHILDGGRNFVRYDVDSPIIRSSLQSLFAQYLPAVTDASTTQGRLHLLANEPNFATRKGGWQSDKGVSALTMDRYRDWLREKYTDISRLNQVYGKSYTSFEDARDAMVMPIDPESTETRQGGPVWYDWCRFNMDRVNDWFTFLKTGVQENDPMSAPVTIKVLGRQLSTEWRDDGMDLEYLAGLMDVLGADSHTIPAGMTNANLKGEQEWLDHYALEWVMQSMLLDFYKSLYPGKPYYDSEWHGFSTQRWVDFSMDRSYVRAALWLGFTHGMNAIQSWVWGRQQDGSFLDVNSNFVGEVITQPTALDAYGRTLKELNAHAQEVTRLAGQQRQVYLYYCEEAAIQDLSYIPDLQTVYESLKLLNLRVGFTTPSRLPGLSGRSPIVIVPPSLFLSDKSLSVLEDFVNSGGKVILVDSHRSFLKNELGMDRADPLAWTPLAEIGLDDADELARAMQPILHPLVPEPLVPYRIMDKQGDPALGVIVMQGPDQLTNSSTIVLINTSKHERVVELGTGDDPPSVVNSLTNQPAGKRFRLPPCDVLLLRAIPD